jgi:hypothetical protein
LWVDFLCRIA